jgi:hypothetical protein
MLVAFVNPSPPDSPSPWPWRGGRGVRQLVILSPDPDVSGEGRRIPLISPRGFFVPDLVGTRLRYAKINHNPAGEAPRVELRITGYELRIGRI